MNTVLIRKSERFQVEVAESIVVAAVRSSVLHARILLKLLEMIKIKEIIIPIRLKIIVESGGDLLSETPLCLHDLDSPPTTQKRSPGRQPKFVFTPEQITYSRQHNFSQFRERFPELVESYGKRLVIRKFNKAKKGEIDELERGYSKDKI